MEYCEYCREAGHSTFDCADWREWHLETRESEAALRLNPVVNYDPDEESDDSHEP
mgnify:CR=1 FL=1|jgi:hypothetical protein